MRDVHGDACVARDRDRLVHRGGEANGVVRLVAQVGVVHSAEFAGDLGQRDDFVGRREALRRVEQPGRKAERAFAHRHAHESLLLRQFGGGRRAPLGADHRLADRPEAGESGEVDPHRLCSCARQQVSDLGRAAAVIANERGCHPLHQERLDEPTLRVVCGEPAFYMRMRIDETGRDDHPARVDRASSCNFQVFAHGDDAVPANHDIAGERLGAAGIDRAAANEEVGLEWR